MEVGGNHRLVGLAELGETSDRFLIDVDVCRRAGLGGGLRLGRSLNSNVV